MPIFDVKIFFPFHNQTVNCVYFVIWFDVKIVKKKKELKD